MFKHILICTDGSPIANKAAKGGIALAKALRARVTAYCGLEDLIPLYSEGYAFDPPTMERYEEAIRTVAQKRVDTVVKLAKAARVPVDSLVTNANSTYEGIIAAAKKQKCDVIVMGSHGRSGLSKLIMGSVTQKVLAHSRIPVVVYR